MKVDKLNVMLSGAIALLFLVSLFSISSYGKAVPVDPAVIADTGSILQDAKADQSVGKEIVEKNDFKIIFEQYFTNGLDKDLGLTCDGFRTWCFTATISNSLATDGRKFNLTAAFFNTSFADSNIKNIKIFNQTLIGYYEDTAVTTCKDTDFVLKNGSIQTNNTCTTVRDHVPATRLAFVPLNDVSQKKQDTVLTKTVASKNVFDANEVQTYLITFQTPTLNYNGFGVAGGYGIIDAETQNLYHPTFIANYDNRVNITNASAWFRNQTIYVNLSSAGVAVTTPKGMELRITDFDNNPLPYQTLIRGIWYKGTGEQQNVSADWQKDNYTVVLLPSNYTINGFYIYYRNSTQQGDSSTSLLIRKDSFDSYALGSLPPGVWGTTGMSIFTVSTSGKKGVTTYNGTNPEIFINVSVEKNFTANLEVNATDFTAGTEEGNLLFDCTSATGCSANTYILPREENNHIWSEKFGSTDIGNATATINQNNYAVNYTIGRTGSRLYTQFRNSTGVMFDISADNGISNTSSRVDWNFNGGVGLGALISMEWFNTTVLIRTQPTLSFIQENTAQYPTVIIQAPANQTYNATNITLKFTANITSENISGCWYVLNSGPNVTLANCQNSSFIAEQNSNNLTVFANGSSGNIASAQVFFWVDSIFPTVSIVNPTNITYTVTNISLLYNRNDTSLDKCTRELNGVNATIIGCTNTTILASQGANILRVYVNDTAGNQNVSTVQFTVDSLAPTVTILSPTNTSYDGNHSIGLIYTVSDQSPPITCKYNLDGTGLNAITNCNNITLNFTSLGAHNVILNATDFLNNSVQIQTNFTIINSAPVITIISPTNTTFFSINVSLTFTVTQAGNDIISNCWYNPDNTGQVNFVNCQNTTAIFASGGHTILFQANDSWNAVGNATVNFTVFQGLNLSTTLENGTAVSAWNISFRNTTGTQVDFIGVNNSFVVSSAALPQGLVTVNVTKSGFDSEIFNVTINSTMGIVNHTFTIYPFSFISFYDSQIMAFISNWQVSITNSSITYVNTSVSSQFTISNRLLTNGTNTITAIKPTYVSITALQSVDRSLSFNLTLSTTSSQFGIQVLDELTLKPLSWTGQLRATNTTAAYFDFTAYRNSTKPCLYDGNTADNCVFAGPINGGGATSTVTNSFIQAFDYNVANFTLSFSSTTSTNGFAFVTVSINGTTVYTSPSIVNTNATYTFLINNTAAQFAKSANVTVALTVTLPAQVGTPGADATLSELRLIGPYQYTTDKSITFTQLQIQGFSQFDLWIQGESTYEPGYTNQRMYRIALSPQSNFTITGYLLQDTLGFTQLFSALDSNNQPIEGALFTLSKWYSQVRTTVAQCATNPAGSCGIFMQANAQYGFNTQSSGFAMQDEPFTQFTGNPNPAIVYFSTNVNANFTSVFDGISVQLLPTTVYLSSPFNASCQITAINGNLNFMNFTITRWENGTEYAYNTTFLNSAPSGATIQYYITQNGRYSLNCNYQFVANSSGTLTTFYNVAFEDVWFYNDSLQNGASGFGQPLGLIIALGIIILVGGAISTINIGYGMGAGIILMIAFSFMGFFNGLPGVDPLYMVILTILGALAVLFLRTSI